MNTQAHWEELKKDEEALRLEVRARNTNARKCTQHARNAHVRVVVLGEDGDDDICVR